MTRALAALALLLITLALSLNLSAVAALPEPQATATPDVCLHVATAGAIKIYRCMDDDESNLFYVNNLGFMLNEP